MTRAFIIGFEQRPGGPLVDAGIYLLVPSKIPARRGTPVLLRSVEGVDAIDAVVRAAELVRRIMPRLLDHEGMAHARQP